MAEIAKQIGVFIMALIIVGIPLIYGLIIDGSDDNNIDDNITCTILSILSAIDLFLVIVLINHCI